MKSFISRVTLSVCVAASAIFMSNFASAETKGKWDGLYAGGHLGYSIVDQDIDFGDDDSGRRRRGPFVRRWQYETDNDADGFVGGAHIGFNHQRGNFVIGVEADYSVTTSDIGFEYKSSLSRRGRTYRRRETSLNIEMDSLASLRGRVGYAHNDALFFVTGGIAWTSIDLDWKSERKRRGRPTRTRHYSDSENLTGYVLGAGAEYMLTDGFSIRGEVLHYGFDEEIFGEDIDLDATVARVGFSIKIN